MPLETGKSKEAFSRNVATEVNAGKPKEQAVAIAYAKQRGDSSSVKLARPDAEKYTKAEAIENHEANLRYFKEQLAIQKKRAQSKNKDEAEDGKASISWAQEGIDKETRQLAQARARTDSSSLAALDPVKLDACAAKADALLKRMDSLDGKFQHHKGKDNVRPDAEDEYVMNPIRIGSKVSYKGQTGIVEGPLRYKKSKPFLFVNLDISHKQITDDPKKFKLA